ncbi:cysteine dioxygenase family protein [Vibrio kyushuensis]|uniref:cysteine dioxygenase n=1 Tax=Vibrio kyushuensis TaxID=2910249 RepID=UPI003D135862
MSESTNTATSTNSLRSLIGSDDTICFDEFLVHMEAANKPLSLSTIRYLLDKVTLSNGEVKRLASFQKENYCRRRLFRSEQCEILILSWLNGQRSKIHDHLNSACGVKILLGDATETVFDTADNGQIYATNSTFYKEGSVTVGQDDDIHQISNLQSDDLPLVTLHVYSPPLQAFHIYQLDGSAPELLNVANDSWFYEI